MRWWRKCATRRQDYEGKTYGYWRKSATWLSIFHMKDRDFRKVQNRFGKKYKMKKTAGKGAWSGGAAMLTHLGGENALLGGGCARVGHCGEALRPFEAIFAEQSETAGGYTATGARGAAPIPMPSRRHFL
jgi:hypothetical protein